MTRYTFTGRFKGTHQNDCATPLGVIPASGNPLDMFFADYFRVAEGKIVECVAVWDRLGLVAQLGANVGADSGRLPAVQHVSPGSRAASR
jgi:hypothetical protein